MDPGEEPEGPAAPLFLHQTEAWKAERNFGDPPPPSPRLSQGLDPALLPVVTAFYKTGSLGI